MSAREIGRGATHDEIVRFFAVRLEAAYDPDPRAVDQRRRRAAIEGVVAAQELADPDGLLPQQIASAAVALLQSGEVSPPTRAYGAAMLTRVIEAVMGRARRDFEATAAAICADAHYGEVAAWIADADAAEQPYGCRMQEGCSLLRASAPPPPPSPSTIHRAVVASCATLVATAAMHAWPAGGGDELLDRICFNVARRRGPGPGPGPGAAGPSSYVNNSDLAAAPNALRVLREFCSACLAPNFRALKGGRPRELVRRAGEAVPAMLQQAVAAIARQFEYVRDLILLAARGGAEGVVAAEAPVLRAVCADAAVAFEVLGMCAAAAPDRLGAWKFARLDEVFVAIFQLAGAAVPPPLDAAAVQSVVDAALDAAAAMLCSLGKDHLAPCLAAPADFGWLVGLCGAVCRLLEVFSTTGSYAMVGKVLEVLVATDGLRLVADTGLAMGDTTLLQYLFASVDIVIRIPSAAFATDALRLLVGALSRVLADLEGAGGAAAPPEALAAIVRRYTAALPVDSLLTSMLRLGLKPVFTAAAAPSAARRAPFQCSSEEMSSYVAEARAVAAEGCATGGAADTDEGVKAAYGDLRAALSAALAALAFLFPATAHQLVAHVLASFLVAPGPHDPRSRHGSVLQQSECFGGWEMAEFVVAQVLPTALQSPLADRQAGLAAFARQREALCRLQTGGAEGCFRDATLAPPYLNIWMTYWGLTFPQAQGQGRGQGQGQGGGPHGKKGCAGGAGAGGGPGAALHHRLAPLLVPGPPPTVREFLAAGSLQPLTDAFAVLMHFMTLGGPGGDPADLDLASARKRAYTAAIRLCSDHIPAIAAALPADRIGPFTDAVRREFEGLLVRNWTRAAERALLNEALVAVSAAMPEGQGRDALEALVGAPLRVVSATCQRLGSGADLARLFCAEERDTVAEREAFKGAVATLASALRRCRVTPASEQMAGQVIPVLGGTALLLHGLQPRDFPPGFEAVLDPTDDEQREQLETGGGCRRPPDQSSRVGHVRAALTNLRLSTYQGIACLPRFMNPADFAAGVRQMLVGCERLHLRAMRTLCEHCLFIVTAACPPLIEHTLDAVGRFFAASSSRNQQQQQQQQQQQCDERQFFYFSRDVLCYIIAALVDSRQPADGAIAAIEAPFSFSGDGAGIRIRGHGGAAPDFPCLQSPGAFRVFVAAMESLLLYGYAVRETSLLALAVVNEACARVAQSGAAAPGSAFVMSTAAGDGQQQQQAASRSVDELRFYADAATTLFAATVVGVMTNPQANHAKSRAFLTAMIADVYFPNFAMLRRAMESGDFDFVQAFAPRLHPGYLRTSIAFSAPEDPLYRGSAALMMDDVHTAAAAATSGRRRRDVFVRFLGDMFGVDDSGSAKPHSH